MFAIPWPGLQADPHTSRAYLPYDVHSKGKAMAAIEFSYSKLTQSVCFELPKEKVKKELEQCFSKDEQWHVGCLHWQWNVHAACL